MARQVGKPEDPKVDEPKADEPEAVILDEMAPFGEAEFEAAQAHLGIEPVDTEDTPLWALTAVRFDGSNLVELEELFPERIRLNELGVQAKVILGVDDFAGWVTIPEHYVVARVGTAGHPFILSADAAEQLGITP